MSFYVVFSVYLCDNIIYVVQIDLIDYVNARYKALQL